MFHGTTNNIFHDIKQFFSSNLSRVVSDCTIFVQYFPRTVSKAFVGIFINVHAFQYSFYSGGGANFVLSTSCAGFTTVIGGCAAMVKDGYGAFYSIQENE